MADGDLPPPNPAEAIADGKAVDWQAAGVGEDPQDLSGLRLVSDVAEAMRDLGRGSKGTTLVRGEAAPKEASRRWGHLELREQLGHGGFGAVYRAFDPALNREVALKLFRGAASATDSRFLTEARRLARVMHPNVLAVHGVDLHDGQPGLWTDLLEGKTLLEWVEVNGPLGPGETVAIGTDLCRALAAIHGTALVHGDVKPSNVMREVGGRIVLMDFGAARAQADNPHEPVSGTPIVVAPEVLAGRDPTPASDLYSLGVLLYYLLAKRYPLADHSFEAVRQGHRNHEAVPLSDARPDLPAALVDVIGRALEADPQRRFASAGEMMRALSPSASGPEEQMEPRRTFYRSLTAAGISLVAVFAFLVSALTDRPPSEAPALVRATIALPAEAPLALKAFADVLAPVVAITADGRRVGYIAQSGDTTEIRIRDLASDRSFAVAGTNGAYQLSFSPDGNTVIFGRRKELAKAPVRGGGTVVLAEASLLLGSVWAPSDTIYFVPMPGSGVHSVSAFGGEVRPVSSRALEADSSHAMPEILPEEETILYVAIDSVGTTRIVAQSLRGGEPRVIVEGGSYPRYTDGTLLYAREQSVFAVGFDPASLEVSGSAKPLVEGLLVDPDVGWAPFDVSDSGELIWVAGAARTGSSLVWVDPSGSKVEALAAPATTFLYPRLSPDGHRLVLATRTPRDTLWIYDLEHSMMTRLTFDGENLAPIWTPDGGHITFSRHAAGPPNLHWMKSDGSSSEVQQLAKSDRMQIPGSWSADGQVLAFTESHPENGQDLWLLRLDPQKRVEAFLTTSFDEYQPAISPAGGWLAYTSNETGRPEIYVRALQGSAVRRRVSVSGGSRAVWSRDGEQLLFWSGEGLMAIAFDPDSGAPVGPSRHRFERPLEGIDWSVGYDLGPDGRLLAVNTAGNPQSTDSIQLAINWRGLLPVEN